MMSNAAPALPAGLRLRRVRLVHPDAERLVAQVQQEYVARYGGPDETPFDAAEFDPPTGEFFVGYLDGAPVASGGWRFRPDVQALERVRAAEVKRMYVVPEARRAGHARVVLAHLEDAARAGGADLMVLETGLRQPEAIALYTSAGYQPVPPFGHYACAPGSRYYGKPL